MLSRGQKRRPTNNCFLDQRDGKPILSILSAIAKTDIKSVTAIEPDASASGSVDAMVHVISVGGIFLDSNDKREKGDFFC